MFDTSFAIGYKVVTVEKDTFQKGDSVRIHGQKYTGKLVKVTGKYANIAFRTMKVNVLLSQVEKIQEVPITVSSIKPTVRVFNLTPNAFFSFDTTIDLHGLSVQGALSAVDQWIDRASLLGHSYLKVIHGKGKGILRNVIRTYLQSHPQVKRVINTHPYSEGEGVTCLEIN